MTVSFRSEWPEVAETCFQNAFYRELPDNVQYSHTAGQAHYMFITDELVRDVRSWGADALGCGLIVSFSVVVA